MVTNTHPFKIVPYKQNCIRSIYTAQPSQDLYDDIADSEDYGNLFDLEMNSSLIDRQQPHIDRTFQYGKADELYTVFNPPWSKGRFGDGITYGVFYSAEDKVTSYLEALWHFVKWSHNLHKYSSKDWIESDRKVFEIEIDSQKFASLINDHDIYDSLISNDYAFSRQIASEAISNSIEGLRTPSARNKGGVCVPLFQKKPIKSEKVLRYVKFQVNVKTGDLRITGDAQFSIPYTYNSIITS
jgi:hypothetical protein